ncbi:MAG: 50S ribosomal protein 6 [Candidatus Caenarcaniphilales bacterium]|jgi:hypothetical protein|nr:50S ribosomal protein 6 [Candidatus Caenarcaniphilales bacterium]
MKRYSTLIKNIIGKIDQENLEAEVLELSSREQLKSTTHHQKKQEKQSPNINKLLKGLKYVK